MYRYTPAKNTTMENVNMSTEKGNENRHSFIQNLQTSKRYFNDSLINVIASVSLAASVTGHFWFSALSAELLERDVSVRLRFTLVFLLILLLSLFVVFTSCVNFLFFSTSGTSVFLTIQNFW